MEGSGLKNTDQVQSPSDAGPSVGRVSPHMHLHPTYLKGFPWNVLGFPQHSESPTPNAWVQAHEGPLGHRV